MNEWITAINDALWTYVLVAALVGCGLWFTWRTRFVQFRMVGEMLRLLTDSAVDTIETQVKEKGEEGRRRHISSFQASSFNFMAVITICSDFGAPQK